MNRQTPPSHSHHPPRTKHRKMPFLPPLPAQIRRKLFLLFLANIFFITAAILLGVLLPQTEPSGRNLILIFWIVFLGAEIVAAVWFAKIVLCPPRERTENQVRKSTRELRLVAVKF